MSGWENDDSFYSDESEDELEVSELIVNFPWIQMEIDEIENILDYEQYADENGDVEMESSDEDAVGGEDSLLLSLLPRDNLEEPSLEILENSGDSAEKPPLGGDDNSEDLEDAVVPSGGLRAKS